MESLTPWKKATWGMNRIISSSKFILSLFNYSHDYELEYSCDVMLLIYELEYSLCVNRVSSLMLCLINIFHLIKARVRLDVVVHRTARCAQFITCRSVGSESRVSWADSAYVGEVPGYGEVGVCIALAPVRWMVAGGDSLVRA